MTTHHTGKGEIMLKTAVTLEWHVYAGGRWRVESVPVGHAAPVNAWVSAERMAPVVYRHQAAQCRGECRLECGHALTYGCDCDTIAAEAADQDGGTCECGHGPAVWGRFDLTRHPVRQDDL